MFSVSIPRCFNLVSCHLILEWSTSAGPNKSVSGAKYFLLIPVWTHVKSINPTKEAPLM